MKKHHGKTRKETKETPVTKTEHKGVPSFWKFFNPRLARDYSGGEREQIISHQILLAVSIMFLAVLILPVLYFTLITK